MYSVTLTTDSVCGILGYWIYRALRGQAQMVVDWWIRWASVLASSMHLMSSLAFWRAGTRAHICFMSLSAARRKSRTSVKTWGFSWGWSRCSSGVRSLKSTSILMSIPGISSFSAPGWGRSIGTVSSCSLIGISWISPLLIRAIKSVFLSLANGKSK